MGKTIEKDYQQVLEELSKPFEAHEIEWRVEVATQNANKPISLLVLPYINSRMVMKRLDKVLGPLWKDSYETIETTKSSGFRCILSIKIGDEWISREDAAELSDIEPIKGGYSNALKRAGAKWGIGRYIYDLPSFWVELKDKGAHYVNGKFKINNSQTHVKGYFDTPKLPKWALPVVEKPTQPKNKQAEQETENVKQNALHHIHEALANIEVPENLIPDLLSQTSGSTKPLKDCTIEELTSLYTVLQPVHNYLNDCRKMNLEKKEILYYAQITLKRGLKEYYELLFCLTKALRKETIQLIKDDLQQGAASSQVS
ncbi:MAG: Rad52/Rad22 family DNA repair protein [Psychrobacillus sp.]